MKLISIIIATFNVERTIGRCLESVIPQKGDDIEIIVVDGKSRDNSMRILQKYATDIDKLISEPDKGIYDAWNKGVSCAEGEWIMFVGADDYFLPGAFDKYRWFLTNNEINQLDLISARSRIVDMQGRELQIGGRQYRWDEFRKRMLISHGTTLHNRELFKELGKFDLRYRICADYDFLLRKRMNAAFINEVLFVFECAGVSNSVDALKETYLIRKHHSSVSFIVNIYYFVKAVGGLYYRKWKNILDKTYV